MSRIHFIRIPKTASQSVKATNLFHCSTHQTVKELEIRYGYKWDQEIKFCIVRNPYDRFLSSYFCGYDRAKNQKSPYFNKFKQYSSFRSFCLDEKNPFLYDKVWQSRKGKKSRFLVSHVHFLPQSYWLENHKEKIIIDYILKYENINSEWKRLLKRLKIKHIDLPHKNKSKHYDWKNYYTEEIANVVYQFYKKDFQKFKYLKNSYRE